MKCLMKYHWVKQGQVLSELRREKAGGRASLPLRQMRLGAGGSDRPAEVLPRMRRYI